MERRTARKMPIMEIEKGEQREDLLATSLGPVERVRVMGTVVKKFVAPNYGFFVIDDSTGNIRVKQFEDPSLLEAVKEGSIVDVIGRIREYNGERYIALECFATIGDPNFMTLRLLELVQEARMAKAAGGIEILKEPARVPSGASTEERGTVAELISSLDGGEGVAYERALKASGLAEEKFESAVNSLLEEGLCFEPKPGFLKRL